MERLRDTPYGFLLFLIFMAALFMYLQANWGAYNESTSSLVVLQDGQEPAAVYSPAENSGADESRTRENFFIRARMERARMDSLQRDQLEELMLQEQNESRRDEVLQSLYQLQEKQARRDEAEHLIRLFGFQDALVYLYDSSAVVFVQSGPMNQASVARIADAVAKVTGLEPRQINIAARQT